MYSPGKLEKKTNSPGVLRSVDIYYVFGLYFHKKNISSTCVGKIIIFIKIDICLRKRYKILKTNVKNWNINLLINNKIV